MHSEAKNAPLENISFNDHLPMSWEVIAVLPSEGEQYRYNRVNEELLQSLLLRDDAPQDAEETDVDSSHEHFKRLETRLDLLLSLVTEMMSADDKLPSSKSVELSAQGLCVQTTEESSRRFENKALLKIHLYLNPQFPRPLILCAQLVDTQAQSFTVSFIPLEERLQDLLDKYVFRQHRRAIALARKSEKS